RMRPLKNEKLNMGVPFSAEAVSPQTTDKPGASQTAACRGDHPPRRQQPCGQRRLPTLRVCFTTGGIAWGGTRVMFRGTSTCETSCHEGQETLLPRGSLLPSACGRRSPPGGYAVLPAQDNGILHAE